MATRRRTSATKTAKTATPVKPSASVKSATKKITGAIYSRNSQGNMVMTETPTESPKSRRFATTRPEQPNISLEEYVSDFKVRMQINNYEVMEFVEDCKRWYKASAPVVKSAYDWTTKTVNELSQRFQVEEKTEDEKPVD